MLSERSWHFLPNLPSAGFWRTYATGLAGVDRCAPGPQDSRRAPRIGRLTAGHGVDGDRYHTKRDGPRQMTLIAVEDMAAIAAFLGLPGVAPELLRRNLVTAESICWP